METSLTQKLPETCLGLDGRIQIAGLDDVPMGILLQESEHMSEVDGTITDGQVLVLLPHVVMDVDVADTVAEELHHTVDLIRCVRMADIETDREIGTVDDLPELIGLDSQHHREIGHVLYTGIQPVFCGVMLNLLH